MTAASPETRTDEALLARRQKLLLMLAWGATMLPLVAFGYLTWQSWELNKQVQSAQGKLNASNTEMKELAERKASVEAELAQLNVKLKDQRGATKHYRDLAGIRIQFYREEDREIVEKALVKLGFNIESRHGSERTINRKASAIAYGNLVSKKDLRDIAVALVEAGFPLKRIAPAQRQQDPKLIQIHASTRSDQECGPLSVEQIRAGETCGKMHR